MNYKVVNVNGELISDSIALEVLGCNLTTLNDSKELNEFFPKIVEEISRRGQTYTNELSISTIKMIFTPDQYVEKLNKILSDRGLVHINVCGYDAQSKIVTKTNEELNKVDQKTQIERYKCELTEMRSEPNKVEAEKIDSSTTTNSFKMK